MVELRCGFIHRENKPVVFLKVAVHTPLNGGWSEGTQGVEMLIQSRFNEWPSSSDCVQLLRAGKEAFMNPGMGK